MDDAVADDIVATHWHHLVNALRAGAYDDDLESIRDAELRHTAREPVLDTINKRMTLTERNSDTNGVEDS